MVTLQQIKQADSELMARFQPKVEINPRLTRALVSFQANKEESGYRWFKYREGFSASLVHYILDQVGVTTGTLLDPFAGAGASLFISASRGLDAVGIELLPIGAEIIRTRKALIGADAGRLADAIQKWADKKAWMKSGEQVEFSHLRITDGAFPPENQKHLGRYLFDAKRESNPQIQQLLRFASLCILESISYTRKDGQYLRWDARSGRRQGAKPFDKGLILDFNSAIYGKLHEIVDDLKGATDSLGLFTAPTTHGKVDVIEGSCLQELPKMESRSIDCLITSPPYCNRYDYTRTYALELMMLGVSEEKIKTLRQAMLACTVEHRPKENLRDFFDSKLYEKAELAFNNQECLQKILAYLEQRKEAKLINNPGIPRMVRHYFWEMTLVLFECARVLKAGAPFVMVNDNVRYDGANVSVDLILSDIASQAGFEIEKIWVLPQGKGNSSQQMGEFGREEMRKCVYIWRVPKGSPASRSNRKVAVAR